MDTEYILTKITKMDTNFYAPCVLNQKNYLSADGEFVPATYAKKFKSFDKALLASDNFTSKQIKKRKKCFKEKGYLCEITHIRLVTMHPTQANGLGGQITISLT